MKRGKQVQPFNLFHSLLHFPELYPEPSNGRSSSRIKEISHRKMHFNFLTFWTNSCEVLWSCLIPGHQILHSIGRWILMLKTLLNISFKKILWFTLKYFNKLFLITIQGGRRSWCNQSRGEWRGDTNTRLSGFTSYSVSSIK